MTINPGMARFAARDTPGTRGADDWLSRNTDESFETPPQDDTFDEDYWRRMEHHPDYRPEVDRSALETVPYQTGFQGNDSFSGSGEDISQEEGEARERQQREERQRRRQPLTQQFPDDDPDEHPSQPSSRPRTAPSWVGQDEHDALGRAGFRYIESNGNMNGSGFYFRNSNAEPTNGYRISPPSAHRPHWQANHGPAARYGGEPYDASIGASNDVGSVLQSVRTHERARMPRQVSLPDPTFGGRRHDIYSLALAQDRMMQPGNRIAPIRNQEQFNGWLQQVRGQIRSADQAAGREPSVNPAERNQREDNIINLTSHGFPHVSPMDTYDAFADDHWTYDPVGHNENEVPLFRKTVSGVKHTIQPTHLGDWSYTAERSPQHHQSWSFQSHRQARDFAEQMMDELQPAPGFRSLHEGSANPGADNVPRQRTKIPRKPHLDALDRNLAIKTLKRRRAPRGQVAYVQGGSGGEAGSGGGTVSYANAQRGYPELGTPPMADQETGAPVMNPGVPAAAGGAIPSAAVPAPIGGGNTPRAMPRIPGSQSGRTAGVRESLEGGGWTAHESGGYVDHYTKQIGDKWHVLAKQPGGWIHNSGPSLDEMSDTPMWYDRLHDAVTAAHVGVPIAEIKPAHSGPVQGIGGGLPLNKLNSLSDLPEYGPEDWPAGEDRPEVEGVRRGEYVNHPFWNRLFDQDLIRRSWPSGRDNDEYTHSGQFMSLKEGGGDVPASEVDDDWNANWSEPGGSDDTNTTSPLPDWMRRSAGVMDLNSEGRQPGRVTDEEHQALVSRFPAGMKWNDYYYHYDLDNEGRGLTLFKFRDEDPGWAVYTQGKGGRRMSQDPHTFDSMMNYIEQRRNGMRGRKANMNPSNLISDHPHGSNPQTLWRPYTDSIDGRYDTEREDVEAGPPVVDSHAEPAVSAENGARAEMSDGAQDYWRRRESSMRMASWKSGAWGADDIRQDAPGHRETLEWRDYPEEDMMENFQHADVPGTIDEFGSNRMPEGMVAWKYFPSEHLDGPVGRHGDRWPEISEWAPTKENETTGVVQPMIDPGSHRNSLSGPGHPLDAYKDAMDWSPSGEEDPFFRTPKARR